MSSQSESNLNNVFVSCPEFGEEDMKLLQIMEKMQTELSKLENRVTNVTKDQDSELLQIREKMQTELSKLENKITNVTKGIFLPQILERMQTKLLKLDNKVGNITKGLYWIGGTDEIREGRFVWASTGNSLTFTDWNRGEPNNDESKEDCIEISGHSDRRGMWNDNLENEMPSIFPPKSIQPE
ncbi:mannose-binding protein C-like [Saccostrea echinata]|uniref:mannose-binding protein C-like n=1 Tax=Saccostrea echinata TaxID=191078 RepID=UPI002A823C46|nr:mannose-binding protein C-like [Saccostrea echinata]